MVWPFSAADTTTTTTTADTTTATTTAATTATAAAATLRKTLRDYSFAKNESEQLAAAQAGELMRGELMNALIGAAYKGETELTYVVPTPKTDKYTKQQLCFQLFELLFSPENYLSVTFISDDNLIIKWNE